jgi:hypothetical protein
MQLQPSTERKVFTALFRKPAKRINGVRLISFDPDRRAEQIALENKRAYHRGWYRRNREKVIAKVNAWNKAHPEAVKFRKARWQNENIERKRKANREYARRKRDQRKVLQGTGECAASPATWKEAPQPWTTDR